MDKRTYFKESEHRNHFFLKIRKTNKFKSWSELSNYIETSRSMLEHYRFGRLTIPYEKFSRLINILSLKERNYFNKLVNYKSDNWGAIKGGKITYERYPEHFEENRRKALKKIVLKCKFDVDIPLSENLCEVLGAFIGDGFYNSYRKGNYLIQFAGHSFLDLDYYNLTILPYIFNLYKKNLPKPRFIKKGNCMWINIYSKSLFKLFERRFLFPLGKKCYTVKIPDEIMKSNDKFIRSSIKGIFDTDGCVFFDKRKSYKKPYPRITLQVASRNLYLQLVDYLSKHFNLYSGERPKRRFYIDIYGHSQLKKWMSIIGFSNPRHLNKLPR